MSLIILIPALISCWIVARRSASEAFFRVWMPCLMLLPMYFYFRAPHLPPVGFADCAAFPILLVMLMFDLRTWQWRPMDFLILAFIFFMFLSETHHTGLHVGGLELESAIMTCMFPYMAGRIYLEQPGNRGRFLKLFLGLLCVVAVLCVVDFAGSTSLYQKAMQPLFRSEPVGWPIQTRFGFGRSAGPYAQSILAGMMFLIGLMLSTGMRYFAPTWGTRRVLNVLPLPVRTLVTALMAAGLLMTQSRGPIFGVLIGLVVMQIARAYNTRRAMAVIGIVVVIMLAVGLVYVKEYTAGELTSAKDLDQQNAIYRKQLIPAYSQIVLDGGLLGWGITDYPKALDLDSIDNQYLLLAVTQGYIGLFLFLCISLGTVWQLYRMMPFATGPPDKWLLFTLIATFVALLITLSSVFLGTQVYLIFFLLVGWVQALRSPLLVKLQLQRKSPPLTVKVYT